MAVTAGGDGMLRFWDVPSGHLLWTLQAQQSAVVGLSFDGSAIVTHALNGEIARWELPKLPSSRELGLTLERIVRCLPVRFDDETRGLVEHDPRCD
jgi:WD40 repeat protein